jgi:hypothetical protein
MKTTHIPLHCDSHDSNSLTIGEVVFDPTHLLELSVEVGFYKRAPRKIDICSLLGCLCTASTKGSPSCNDLAAGIETSHPLQGPSRQAVHLRMGKSLDDFMDRLLAEVVNTRICDRFGPDNSTGKEWGKTAGYKRILVQDSTIIHLPQHLFTEFSGVANGHAKVCNARVQATYDLLGDRLVSFSIDPYSRNDLMAAADLQIEPGDLVLRDRGYLTMDEIKRHREHNADCIYRHKTGVLYLDPETQLPIDLPALLRQSGCLDINVLLNNEARTPVRLVAAPVSEETANLRRMKAKKENHGHNPSKAVLELMSYTIFITTIETEQADFQQLLTLYGLRWRIEVIFKAWKSHVKFDLLHRVSKFQMHIICKARLLLIACCTNIILGPLQLRLSQGYQARISLLKLMRFLCASPDNFIRAVLSLSADTLDAQGFTKTVLRYCCYDRRNRKNHCEILLEAA